MKATDFIVEFLISKNISDVFGYPGGMVTHLIDSFSKYENLISAHLNYHEQAAAFAACGYAQSSLKTGVAYATSGPGATNLITGICNAFFDSIPVIFLTGQVNTSESKKKLKIRQKGFQETDIVSMVENVTKFSAYVDSKEKLKYYLEKAHYYANEGRKGPVLLDIPMDIQNSDISSELLGGFNSNEKDLIDNISKLNVSSLIKNSKRPCILIGAGIKNSGMVKKARILFKSLNIPVISSMLAFDVLANDDPLNFGFLGAYGDRYANFIVAKSDLIIALGSRLDLRQIGAKKENFAVEADLVRFDIDKNEFDNKIKENEIQIYMDINQAIPWLFDIFNNLNNDFSVWLSICNIIKNKLKNIDFKKPNKFIEIISEKILDDVVITTDVGQNQVWVAQSFKLKNNQKVLFSGGHGAMGYSLPAAIGAYYGFKRPVICFTGDGGFQMNIQELEFISRENLPITIILLNNKSLGMIRHFQEMYFESEYTQTMKNGGYTTPNFEAISKAYGLDYQKIELLEDIGNIMFDYQNPSLIEIFLPENTHVFPKLEFGKLNQDQEPLLDRKLYNFLMNL